jgi:sugar/nucleoside kinase (ribokinase family)
MAARVAVLLSQLGMSTEFVSVVGRDFVEETVGYLQRFGVGTRRLAVSDEPTTISVILTAGDCRQIRMGLSRSLQQQRLPPRAWKSLTRIRQLYCDGSGNVELQCELAERAKVVVIDLEEDTPQTRRLAAAASIICTSEEFLTGRFPRLRPEDAIQRLAAECGPKLQLAGATLGKKGAIFCDVPRRRLIRSKSLPVQCLDPTGAGDAYHAGLAWGAFTGQSTRVMIAAGTATASLTVEVLGIPEEIPPAEFQRRLRAALDSQESATCSGIFLKRALSGAKA